MALTADKSAEIADGDQAFYRVDTRRPPHELEAGVCADAVNYRFEDGRPWPRFGVRSQPWGEFQAVIPAQAALDVDGKYVVALRKGYQYTLTLKKGLDLLFISTHIAGVDSNVQTLQVIAGQTITFTASMDTPYLTAASLNSPHAAVSLYVTVNYVKPPQVHGYARFNDAQGFDVQLVATDDWRDGSDEDGGRGRLWRILSGNGAVQVPLNGNDIWATVRLIPCFNGVAMLRQGNERHYFSAVQNISITNSDSTAGTITCDTKFLLTGDSVQTSISMSDNNGGAPYAVRVISSGLISLYDNATHAGAGGATGLIAPVDDGAIGTLFKNLIDTANSRLHLNCTQDWNNGDKVTFNIDLNSSLTGGSGKNPPNPGAAYYVKMFDGNQVELYSDAALTIKITFDTAIGRFWLERQADFPGFYGNGAPPLLARPNAAGNTWLDIGMVSVPTTLEITSTTTSGINQNVLAVPQHGLIPSDPVTVTGIHTTAAALISGTVYVYPISPDAVRLYSTAVQALAAASGGTDGVIPLTVDGETGTMTRAGATGLPMPSGREGLYFQNRLLVVNASDTLMISDALDPLHFTPFTSALTANLGSSDPITALWPYGPDAVLILRGSRVDILNNLSGGADAWTLTNITEEYGCIAPLSIAQTGSDVWFLSRKGVSSVTQTENGAVQGVADPVSKAMKKYIDQIDWAAASQAAGGYWNNRYFVAIPLKGQFGSKKNNGILSHNFLNVAMAYSEAGGTYKTESEYGWEGLWQGDLLTVYGFVRNSIYGEERMAFVDYTGTVRWLSEDFMDGNAQIQTNLVTRRFNGGNMMRKLWLTSQVMVDAYAPTLTITAIFPGVNETRTLVTNKMLNAKKYLVYGLEDYDPSVSTQATFNAPFRADYLITAGELLSGAPDTHQNHPLPFRLRRVDWGMQIMIQNTTGSARIQAVDVGGYQKEFTSTKSV